MDSSHVVLEISSDEEGWGPWGEIEGDGGGDAAATDDGYDWISAFLSEVDRQKVDDSDDVVLVGEVVANPNQRLKSSSATAKLRPNDLDDDCVILDGDPDKPVVMENNSGGDSDDLLIVAEKGEVACRDYPHPRHLCSTFPFTSTAHERHCYQCHCYVCDLPAPCIHWGTGNSVNDHCHAHDKDKSWQMERQNLKDGSKAPLLLPSTSLLIQQPGPPQTIRVQRPTLLQPNSLATNQISQTTTIRACSTSTNFSIPNIISPVRSQRYSYPVPRNKFHPHLVSQQLNNNIARKDRRHNASIGPQLINKRTIFKRAGSAGVALASPRSGYGSPANNYVSQHSPNPSPMATLNDKNPSRWQDVSDTRACQNPSQRNPGNGAGDIVRSQPQAPPLQDTGCGFVNRLPSQHQVSLQPNLRRTFVNAAPSPQAPSCANMGSNFGDSVISQPEVPSQPNTGSSFINQVPSQPQVHSQSTLSANDIYQQENAAQNAMDASFSDLGTSWVSLSGLGNQQPFPGDAQVQSTGDTNHPPFATEFDPVPVNTSPGSLNLQFDNWMFENFPASGAPEVSVPPGLNVYSPVHAPVDSDFFFDF